MKKYVAGFMFQLERNPEFSRVALIRKQKPEDQKNLLNGIGGKIEDEEESAHAMVREFYEETGMKTHHLQWIHFSTICGMDWLVDFFATYGHVDHLENKENNGEVIEVVYLKDITPIRKDMIENLCWLISLGLDSLSDGRPAFTSASYPS